MHCLIFAAYDVLGDCPEPCLEIRNGIVIRIIIIHSETSSEVYVAYSKSVTLEICYDVVHSLTFKGIYLLDSCDLRSDVEMQTDEIDVLALLEDIDKLVELVLGDSELVFI